MEEYTAEESFLEENVEMESVVIESTAEAQVPYYLSEADRVEVTEALIEMGESYGLQYNPELVEGETWDSPTPIYAEELVRGREFIIAAMVEYTEGAFALMNMEGCTGFGLQIKEYPNTVTEAYYEVYVYWM